MNLVDKQNNTVTVSDNSPKQQFDINYPDQPEAAGFAAYKDHEGDRIFYHTVVGEEYGGRGLASILVAQALEETKTAGLTVIPVCPFVKGYLEKNDFDGEFRAPRQEDITWLRSQI